MDCVPVVVPLALENANSKSARDINWYTRWFSA
jgi:hypothetical protein